MVLAECRDARGYRYRLLTERITEFPQLAVDSGIGYLAATAREFIRTDVLLFVIVLYALLGKLSDTLTRLLERRLLGWQPQYQKTARREVAA